MSIIEEDPDRCLLPILDLIHLEKKSSPALIVYKFHFWSTFE